MSFAGRDCLEAIRRWPGCETVSRIQVIRSNSLAGFAIRITPYGKAARRSSDDVRRA